MKKLINFTDYNGFYVQKMYKDAREYNAVDSNFLTSNTLYQQLLVDPDNQNLKNQTKLFLSMYEHSPGIIRRYYKNDHFRKDGEDKIWRNPDTVSRDNSMGYIILAGHVGEQELIKDFAMQLLLRMSFFQNTATTKGKDKLIPDFCGPSSWGTILRSCFTKKTLRRLFLVLCGLDFFFMLSLLFDVAKSYIHPNEVSTCYHTISAIMQRKVGIDTPFSKFGSYVYFNYRCVPFMSVKDENEHRLIQCLRQYSRASYDPPIYDVTKVLFKKYEL